MPPIIGPMSLVLVPVGAVAFAFAMPLSILPLAFVLVSVCKLALAQSVSHPLVPFSHVFLSAVQHALSFSVLQVEMPISFVDFSSWRGELPFSMSKVVHPLSFVRGSVGVHAHPTSVSLIVAPISGVFVESDLMEGTLTVPGSFLPRSVVLDLSIGRQEGTSYPLVVGILSLVVRSVVEGVTTLSFEQIVAPFTFVRVAMDHVVRAPSPPAIFLPFA
mmetsp:Transcript_5629/g.34931  ORF Transcript_5629/g.34931 Transcript_5629/m.34931 type:complete len:217 (+) Transcript_5629:2057-2707(+)